MMRVIKCTGRPRRAVIAEVAAVVISWVAILLALLWLTGCATRQAPKTPEEAIAAAQAAVSTAAETLADAADAGIIDRGSEEYKQAKALLVDAGDAVRFAWEALLKGDTREAMSWRNMAVERYRDVRPMIERYAKQMGGK